MASQSESLQIPSQLPVIVIGEGWGALASAALLALRGEKLIWISGTGAHLQSPLPSVEAGITSDILKHLSASFGIEAGQPQTGSYLREFRNKAFREPKAGALQADLWAPEKNWVCEAEVRFSASISEIEQQLRAVLLGEGAVYSIRRVEGIPVAAFHAEERLKVALASGEEIAGSRIIYADRWAYLPQIQGLPKPLPFLRKRETAGVLQASFLHRKAWGLGWLEGFFSALHRESGEDFERHFFGHFSENGMRSCWTLCLSPEESENNHEIAKKYRRMKNALEKIFTGLSGTERDPGGASFLGNIQSEHVRFEEAFLFSSGDPIREAQQIPALRDVFFLTDGYGPSCAIAQAARLLGADLDTAVRPEAQAEGVDFARAPGSQG